MDPVRRVMLCGAASVAVLAVGLVAGRTSVTAPEAIDAAIGRLEAGRSHATLSELQERFAFRAPGQAGYSGAPEWIADQLRAAGVADVEIITHETGTAWYPRVVNVHGVIPGRDRSQVVVLAAHHDTVPAAPGAIDDGGAIAIIIEAARVIAAGEPPGCDVELALFDGEESGLIGSKARVFDLGDEGRARVRAAVAVELVGWTEDRLVMHTLPHGFAWDAPGGPPAWLPAQSLAAARHVGIDVGLGDPMFGPFYQGAVRVIGVLTGSDAGAYLEQGVPASMLTGSSLTNFFSGYHSAQDSMELVDRDRLDDSARVLTALAVELAELDDDARSEPFGGPYLMLGSSLLGRTWFAIVGLAFLLPLVMANATLRAQGRAGTARTLFLLLGISFGALVAMGSVIGLVIGAPLVLALSLAPFIGRAQGVAVVLGFVPFLAQAALIGAAAASFGFRWRAGGGETACLILLIIAAVAVRISLARISPEGQDATIA